MFSQILAKSGSKIRLESSIKNLLPPNDLKNLCIVDFIFVCIYWKWLKYIDLETKLSCQNFSQKNERTNLFFYPEK